MRYVRIKNLKPGDVVHESIHDMHNRLLVASGEALSEFKIKKLQQLGFDGFYIETELTKDIQITDLIPNQLRYKAISDLRNMNIASTIDNAKEIVDNVLSKKDIFIDYIDVRNYENELFQHSIFVAESSIVIGSALGLNKNQLTELAVAALLHDIGKLFKEPKFMKKIAESKTVEEYNEEMHPLYGFRLFKNDSDYGVNAIVNKAILTHHINENGTGTTGSLKYDSLIKETPLYAKIINVVNVYDKKRHTAEIGSPSEAIEHLKGGYGTLYNPEVVRCFLNHIAIYPTGTTVTLSNGIQGIVYSQTKGFPERPKIKLETGQILDLMTRFMQTITIVGTDFDNDRDQEIGKSR
jgi:HD-GYP domain-containing protein (c-di-GMP phosphodiesterase class II)